MYSFYSHEPENIPSKVNLDREAKLFKKLINKKHTPQQSTNVDTPSIFKTKNSLYSMNLFSIDNR